MFLKVSQNSLENICARISFLTKLLAAPATLLKKRLAQVFSREFSRAFFKKTFLKKKSLGDCFYNYI